MNCIWKFGIVQIRCVINLAALLIFGQYKIYPSVIICSNSYLNFELFILCFFLHFMSKKVSKVVKIKRMSYVFGRGQITAMISHSDSPHPCYSGISYNYKTRNLLSFSFFFFLFFLGGGGDKLHLISLFVKVDISLLTIDIVMINFACFMLWQIIVVCLMLSKCIGIEKFGLQSSTLI